MLKGKKLTNAKPRRPAIMIYGDPGAGKTWGSLDFPSLYYIDTEGGATQPHYVDKLKAVDATYMGLEDNSGDLRALLDQIRALATQKHEYKTLVIDSITKPFQTAIQVEHDRLSKKQDMTKSFGAEKKPAISIMRQIVTWLPRLDMTVIFIAHTKTKWALGESAGDTYDAWDKLGYELDLVLHLQDKYRTKVIKSRLDQFKTGEKFNWSYKEFITRYPETTIQSEHKQQSQPATEEEITRFKQLIETTRIPNGTVEKWYTKAGVENESQMDSNTIAKCNHFMENIAPLKPITTRTRI